MNRSRHISLLHSKFSPAHKNTGLMVLNNRIKMTSHCMYRVVNGVCMIFIVITKRVMMKHLTVTPLNK